MTALTFESHGTVIGVRSRDAEVLRRLATRLPTDARLCDAASVAAMYSWRVERAGAHAMHSVTVRCRREPDVTVLGRSADFDEAAALLAHDAEFRVAVHAPDEIFVHAAVVGMAGRAILMPGRSFAGKSTLAAELVRLGAPYYSDEYAVLDSEGLVRAFPRRLMLRDENGGPRDAPTAEALGGCVGREPLPLGGVVLTRFVRGARWSPMTMSRGEIVLALLDHAVDVRARPDQVLERITLAAGENVAGLRGDRGDAATVALDLFRRFS